MRAAGGAVAVLETVSVDSTGFTESAPVPVEDLFERYPVSTFTVRVVDDLGETLPSTFTVTAIVGPVELVDSDGAPRTDWTVSGALPARIRMPATEGTWVWFGTPGTTRLESVMRVASLDDGMVSGEFTSSGVDVALEALRR